MTVSPHWAIVCLGATCLSPISALAATPTPLAPGVSFTQLGPVETIFNWNNTVCNPDHFIPDAPARAWKRADGKVTLIAPEADNWQLVGTSLFTLQASCRPTLYDGYPNGYNPSLPASEQYSVATRGYVGIEATYTLDGQTIYGFGGEDLSALAEAAGCVDQGTGNCWLNGVTAVKSIDQGDDFNFVSNTSLDTAAVDRTISTTRPGTTGYMTTTNIIQKPDGYYYMITHVVDPQASVGVDADCLIRTNNLADPTSWRGWDGKGFNASLQPSAAGATGGVSCVQVGPGSLRQDVYSLQYIPRKNLYIAVMQTRIQLGDPKPVPGAYYSTSPDLMNWSPPARLAVTPLIPGYDSTTEVDEYPVLIDPFSKTRNFETIDSLTPMLVYTRVHLYNNGSTLDRDIVAEPFLMR